ncbi:hypothetical protein MMC20_005759 [Loxospora ochrophaea]|nr:hypothetical protein [Loxospora ochrophaea]
MDSSTITNTNARSQFLHLPPEIRIRIFHFAIPYASYTLRPHAPSINLSGTGYSPSPRKKTVKFVQCQRHYLGFDPTKMGTHVAHWTSKGNRDWRIFFAKDMETWPEDWRVKYSNGASSRYGKSRGYAVDSLMISKALYGEVLEAIGRKEYFTMRCPPRFLLQDLNPLFEALPDSHRSRVRQLKIEEFPVHNHGLTEMSKSRSTHYELFYEWLTELPLRRLDLKLRINNDLFVNRTLNPEHFYLEAPWIRPLVKMCNERKHSPVKLKLRLIFQDPVTEAAIIGIADRFLKPLSALGIVHTKKGQWGPILSTDQD